MLAHAPNGGVGNKKIDLQSAVFFIQMNAANFKFLGSVK